VAGLRSESPNARKLAWNSFQIALPELVVRASLKKFLSLKSSCSDLELAGFVMGIVGAIVVGILGAGTSARDEPRTV